MKKLIITLAALLTASSFVSCAGKKDTATTASSSPAEAVIKPADTQPEATTPLYELAAKHGFKMGVVVNPQSINRSVYSSMVKKDFNSVTASNEFKAYSLLNQNLSKKNENGMPAMVYTNADIIAKFAQENGIGIRGHVLVWDAYMPDWFFRKDFTGGEPFVDRDTMLKRLQYYIDEVVSHFETKFPGVVYCWDVVNEAVADGTNECKADDPRRVRTLRSGNKNLFYEVIGPDYVEQTFKFAREAVNKVNPDIKLFYNDYNTFYSPKKEAIGKLLESINKNEKLCDGLGMQGYVGGYGQQAGCMNPNDIKLFASAIKFYSDMGLEVHVTELALRNYEKDQAAKHEDFYESFFTMLVDATKAGQNLTSVSIWGITDNPTLPKTDYSYKMNGPYCGMINSSCARKPEYYRVAKVME